MEKRRNNIRSIINISFETIIMHYNSIMWLVINFFSLLFFTSRETIHWLVGTNIHD